jgi:tetratricopeptide (TPR) repeat protein
MLRFFLIICVTWVFQDFSLASNGITEVQRSSIKADSSYFFLKRDQLLAEQSGDEEKISAIHHAMGKLLFHRGVYSQSLEHFLLAEELFERLSMDSAIVINKNFLGKLYFKTKGVQEAIARHQEALLFAKKGNDKFGEAYSLSMLGGMYEKSGDYTTALHFQWNALSLLKELDDSYFLPEVYENIGSIHEDLFQLDSALIYFQKAYDLSIANGNKIELISIINNLGDVKRKKKQKKEALEYYFDALKYSREFQEPYQESSALRDLSRTYADFSDFELAYAYLDSSRIVYQQVFSQETATQQVLIEDLFMLKLKEQQIIDLEKDKIYSKQVGWALAFLMTLFISLVAVSFSRQRIKTISNKKLMEQQKQLFETSKKLMEAELTHKRIEQEKLSKDLEANTKALTTETLHVLEKNKILVNIQEKLGSVLDDDPKVQKRKIKNLLKMIDHTFTQETDWEDFKKSFEKVHEDFFKILHTYSQELSPADVRLASLMKMNLGSKDISSILGISQDSLRISRYRLRKKLNLAKGESLQQFILRI